MVIVNLKSEETALRGVLWQSRGAWLTLRTVALLKTDGSYSPLDGEVIVPRENVAFLQVVSS